MDEKSSGISKNTSMCLYGIAALLMIFHHLFPFDIEGYTYISLGYIKGISIEEHLSVFAKICVAMYSFISGYALHKTKKQCYRFSKKVKSNISNAIKRILKLYRHVWISWILFIPLGIGIGVFSFDTKSAILSFFGKATVYTPAWWYVGQYIKMVILFAIVDSVYYCVFADKNIKNEGIVVIVIISVLFGLYHLPLINRLFSIAGHITYTIIFFEGVLIDRFNVVDGMKQIIKKCNKRQQAIASVLSIMVIIVLRIILANGNRGWELGDVFFISPFMLLIIAILDNLEDNSIGRRFLKEIGQTSTFIWLTHNFVLLYFWDLFMKLKFSLIIYIVLCTVCFCVAYILNLLNKKLDMLLRKNRLLS